MKVKAIKEKKKGEGRESKEKLNMRYISLTSSLLVP